MPLGSNTIRRPAIQTSGGPSRRRVLAAAALASLSAADHLLSHRANAADAAAPTTAPADDRWQGLKAGITTYTFKQRPLEPTIAAIRRVNLHYVSIKDFHLPLKSTADERKAVAEKFRGAGIEPLSCGVIALHNSEKSARQAFEYARDAGIPTIVCSPAADALPLLDKLVKEFDIRLAIHNHGPEDKTWPTPYQPFKAVQEYDPRIGLCIDVGHTARAKADPVEAILKCRDRLYDLHFKDIDSHDPHAKPIEVGRGVLDIHGMLQALLEIRYAHLMSFEYEKDLENDPLPGLAESVGYARGVLSGMKGF